ncbi:hypothetical protein GDO86_018666 [Hymenochirus boettgeri]|uniref:CARD domain-containing protein n=1 Tax=Hymenochirus boettgeri TaxID=247094 RepID=A0A8T2IHF6_9PIPI|nr:hypothetical protein GDO86_018666 [Hymenochirus boettgeri]
MPKSFLDVMLGFLGNLGELEFIEFMAKMPDLELVEGQKINPTSVQRKEVHEEFQEYLHMCCALAFGVKVGVGLLSAVFKVDSCEGLKETLQGAVGYSPPEDVGEAYQRATPTEQMHFVDKLRVALIQRLSHIDPVLDDLLGLSILTNEQYHRVRSSQTPQESVRQLYNCIRSWSSHEKDAFYQSMEKHNRPLIRDLENN